MSINSELVIYIYISINILYNRGVASLLVLIVLG